MDEPLDIGLTIDLSPLFVVTPVLSMLSMACSFNALFTGIGHQYHAPDPAAKQAFLHIHSSMKPLRHLSIEASWQKSHLTEHVSGPVRLDVG